MPLPDGTNAEREDVQPPLNWQTRDDIKDLVLHQQQGSPPCAKIRLLLEYYKIPYKTINGKKKDSSYKKIPVLLASGRQVNDSYVIYKNLVPALCGEAFDEEWQEKITYKLQPGIEVEVLGNKSDAATVMNKLFGLPKCVACCAAGPLGRKIAGGIRTGYPDLRPSAEVGKEFAAKIGTNKFFGGEQPGQVDLAYYGTLCGFHWAGSTMTANHLQDAGLSDWWSRMKEVVPDVMVKKK